MSKRRKGRMATRTDQQRRLPQPWPRPIDVAGKNIANLTSVVGNILVSGPTKTLNYQYVGSHEWDEARRLERRSRTSQARSTKLAAISTGQHPELAALDPVSRYPSARELDRPLHLQGSLFTPERRSIFSQGPFGIVKGIMTRLGM